MPFEPFPVSGPEGFGPVGPGSSTGTACTGLSASQSQSREERQQWEASRARPKRDFTVYQRVPVSLRSLRDLRRVSDLAEYS